MSFILDLTERIRKLIGLDYFVDEDFSFFQPGGNDHSLQFFFKCLPDEYLELTEWDRHNLFLQDLTAELDIEFDLDEDGRFATYTEKNRKDVKSIQAVMDLRDNFLVIVYFFGDSRLCARFNQKLALTSGLNACYLGSNGLSKIAQNLEKIVGIEFSFEQLSSMFLEPVTMRGVLRGDLAHDTYYSHRETQGSFFNVNSISGHIVDGAQGTMIFNSSGMVQIDACRLSSFLDMANRLHSILRERYQNLVEKCVVGWIENPGTSFLQLNGTFIEIGLKHPMDKLDGLLTFLTRGDKTIQFFGLSERTSRKLWSVKSIEYKSSIPIEFEVADDRVRVFLKHRNSIPFLDHVERFLRTHASAELDCSVL